MLVTTIKDIHELAAELASVQHGGTVVQCHGVFDLLHMATSGIFKRPRSQGGSRRHHHAGSVRQQGSSSSCVHRNAARRSNRIAGLRRLHRDQQVADGGRSAGVNPSRRVRQRFRLRTNGRTDHTWDRSTGRGAEAPAASSCSRTKMGSSNLLNQHMSITGGERLPDGVSSANTRRTMSPACFSARTVFARSSWARPSSTNISIAIRSANLVRSRFWPHNWCGAEKFVGVTGRGQPRCRMLRQRAARHDACSRRLAPKPYAARWRPPSLPEFLIMKGTPSASSGASSENYPFAKTVQELCHGRAGGPAEIGRPVPLWTMRP